MPTALRNTALRCIAAAALTALASSSARAQVFITFYNSFPSVTPVPTSPFAGGTVLCQATGAGTSTGLNVNFTTQAARDLIDAQCGMIDGLAASARINASNVFGARLTGFFTAPTAGSFQFDLNHDDGVVMTIGGATVYSRWPGGTNPAPFFVSLLQGENSFTIDYANTACCNAFLDVRTPNGVTMSPRNPASTTVPEPATVVLMGAGLAGMMLMVRRGRRV